MMLANITNYSQPIEGFWDKLEFGGMMVGLGMATIFAVLIVLLFALIVFKFFFHDIPAKKRANATVVEHAETPVVVPQHTADDEIAAVIAAAIAMAESENDGIKFRVVSFKRR